MVFQQSQQEQRKIEAAYFYSANCDLLMKIDLGDINQVVCVSVFLDADKTTFNYVSMKKVKGEISFLKIGKRISSVKELAKELTTRHPILLHFTGKGILNRKIKREENYRHSILLNANLDDFYFTDYLEEKLVYSSVIRKNAAEEIINEFARHYLLIIGMSSGPFITAPLAKFFDKSTFVVDDISLIVENEKIVSFEKLEEPTGRVTIGNDRIDFDVLAPVAAGALFFNPDPRVILSNDQDVFLITRLEAKQKNIFYRFGMGMMFLFLILLTSNYFYLGSLNKKIEENYGELMQFEEQLAELSTLEEEKDRKENLLRSSGLLNKQFLSFYMMELSNSVPSGITFETITLRPLVNEIKGKQKIEIYDHMLTVSGRSKTSAVLSKWIEKLKQEEWLSTIDILDYNYEKNVGKFELEIEVY